MSCEHTRVIVTDVYVFEHNRVMIVTDIHVFEHTRVMSCYRCLCL